MSIQGESAKSHSKGKLRPLLLDKASQRLEALASQYHHDALAGCPHGQHKVAFLILPGIFSPVQKSHLAALDRARSVVAARQGLPVVAGFLAPCADVHVRAALGQDALPMETRSSLCTLACDTCDWLEACTWGWTDPSRTSDRIRKQLCDKLGWVGGMRWEFEAWWVLLDGLQLRAHLREHKMPAVCISNKIEGNTFSERFFSAAQKTPAEAAAAATAPSVTPGNFGRNRRFSSVLALVAPGCCEVSASRMSALVRAADWEALDKLDCLTPELLEALRHWAEDAEDADKAQAAAEPSQQDEGELARDADDSAGREKAEARPAPDTELTPRTPGHVERVTGNAAKAGQCGGQKIIAHICNDQGNGGRGFFQAIKSEWGLAAPRAYFEWHRDRGAGSGFRLGAVQFVQVSKLVEIANIIGQQGSKAGSKGPPVRYDAVEEALQSLGRHAAERGATVHMPRVSRGGSGLDWDKMGGLVKAMAKRHGVTIYVYRE